MVHVYVMSAFSKENKGGNKAGVVLNREDLTVRQKMAIAKELGYSETAFVTHSDVADYKIEYFTPTDEVPLCGHATIATFSLLFHLQMFELHGQLLLNSFCLKVQMLVGLSIAANAAVRSPAISINEILCRRPSSSLICPSIT